MWDPGMFLLGGEMRNLFKAEISDFPHMLVKLSDPLLNQLYQSIHHSVIWRIERLLRQCFLSALFSPKCPTWFLNLGSASQWEVMLCLTLYEVPWLTGESSTDIPCWEIGSRDSLIAIFNYVSFWKDTDGVTVASISILLYLSWRQSSWVTHHKYILICCILCSFTLNLLTW